MRGSVCGSLISVISHCVGSIGGKNVSASAGSAPSISVMASLSAKGSVSAYTRPPPMMNASGSADAISMASVTEWAVSVDGALQSGSEVMTMLRRLGSAPLGSDSNVWRPIMTVWPVVSALKRLRSSEIWYMSSPLRPIAPRDAVMAAIIVSIIIFFVAFVRLRLHL